MPLHKKLLWSLGEAILLVFCIMVYKHDEIIFFYQVIFYLFLNICINFKIN